MHAFKDTYDRTSWKRNRFKENFQESRVLAFNPAIWISTTNSGFTNPRNPRIRFSSGGFLTFNIPELRGKNVSWWREKNVQFAPTSPRGSRRFWWFQKKNTMTAWPEFQQDKLNILLVWWYRWFCKKSWHVLFKIKMCLGLFWEEGKKIPPTFWPSNFSFQTWGKFPPKSCIFIHQGGGPKLEKSLKSGDWNSTSCLGGW